MGKVPQLEDGYLKTANELQDAFCKTRIPGEVRQIIDCVVRLTYGYSKKEAIIPNTLLVKMTGLKKQNVSRALSKTITNKLVIKSDDKVRLNKNYSEWVSFDKSSKVITNKKSSKVITPVIKSDDKKSSKVITDSIYINNKDNYKDREKSLAYLKNIPLKDIEEFKKICTATENQIKQKGESFHDYCLSYGKKYKDYKAALRNALRKDYQKTSELDVKYVLSG